MRIGRGVAALAIGLVVVGTGAPARAGPSGSFGAWVVTCTDGLTCTASVSREGSDVIASLGIERPGDPQGAASLVIGFNKDEKPDGDVTFTVDGAEPNRVPAARFETQRVGLGISLADAEGGAPLRQAMRDGRTIRVTMPTSGGARKAEFSLKGLAASLRFMDEAQRREGTAGAFVAVGDKPLPDPATLPKDITERGQLPASVAALWRAEGCDDVDESVLGALGFSTPVSDGRLYGLVCGMPGAYNVNYAMFAENGGNAYLVPLPGIDAKGPVAAITAMNVDWDDRTRRLESFAKYRGLGDCGLWQRWTLDPDNGAAGAFVLTEAREKADCDETYEDVDRWPRLWPPTK